MRTIRQDIRYGFRVLKNNPGFTAVAVFTLALGISVNTTVFGWIDSVLLRPLPGVGNPAELVLLESVTSGGANLNNLSYVDYRDYRDNLRLVSGLAMARITPLSVGPSGRTERAWADLVSANYFDVLRVKPALGRTFLPEEAGDKPGAYPVAVISHRMWRTRFRGDRNVLGKTIRLNRHELTIVGVAPEEFRGTMPGLAFDVWMPITMAADMGTGGGTLTYRNTRDITTTIARLKPGVTIEQVRAEAGAVALRLAEQYPRTNRGIGITARRVRDGHNAAQGLLFKPLQILMAVCLLLLLIVCANVANLLLARAVSRYKEFGIRQAMGAGRGRLVMQLLTETLLLAAAGGGAGALLAMWMGPALQYLLPPNDFPIAIDGGLSLSTLGFTVLIAVAATLVSGTAPALICARTGFGEALKEGGRGGGAGTHSHRLRGLLVIAEVALAAVALTGAGLFIRTFRNASAIQPGFDMTNVGIAQFYLSSAGYSGEEQRQLCRTLRERAERIPGVTGASYSDAVPLTFAGSGWNQMEIEGYTPARGEDMTVHFSLVPPGYFDLLRIPLPEGRDFTERDEAGAPIVAIVNETFARRYFGGRNAIGRKVKMESRPATVVGVVRDIKYGSLTETAQPHFYAPFRQIFGPGLNFTFFIKTAGDPTEALRALRREALALNPDAVSNTRLLSQAATAALYPQKVAAILLSVLGGVSLLLAGIGLYSVMSYAVSQRTHELGLRMALGAQPAGVLGMVVRQGLMLALPGLAMGLTVSLAASRLVGGMLVNMSPADPLTFGAAAAFLSAIALAACAVPALRATRVDPMVALRCQ